MQPVRDIEAQVRRVCTVAYACRCLTLLDLPAKAAERHFLERFPLPDDVRPWLWLKDPADWTRLEDAARAWVDGGQPSGREECGSLEDLVQSWWDRDVRPSAYRCHGSDRPDLQDYLCALRARDDHGCCVA